MIRAPRDYEAWEIAAAVLIGLCIQVGTGTGMYLARSSAPAKVDLCAQAPPECPLMEEPKCESKGWVCVPIDDVAVKPVIDQEAVELAKLGGKKAVLPEMWDRAPESVKSKIKEQPPVVRDTAAPSTQASQEIPDAGKVANIDAMTTGPEDSDTTEPQPDAAPQDGADAGRPEGDPDASVATLDPDGGTSNSTEPGCQGEGCSKDGTNKDYIAAQYLGRLISFFKRGFVVTGLGLPPEEIKGLAVSVTVTLSGDGTVLSFSMGSSNNPTFDAAARSAMQSKVGSAIPPYPEDRPDLKKSSLSFTMTCGSACN